MPGHFVNITGNGRSKPPASVARTDPDGQFFVRITVSCTIALLKLHTFMVSSFE